MRTCSLSNGLLALSLLATVATSGDAQVARRIPKRSFGIHGPWLVAGTALGTPSASDPARATIVTPTPVPVSDGRTPAPASAFVDTARLDGIDPGIAVGKQFVLLTDNDNGIAVYRRDGTLPAPGTFPLVIRLDKLFKQASDDAGANMKYPTGTPVAWQTGIVGYGDARVAYDPWRGRFWIYVMGKNQRVTDSTVLQATPILRLNRRNKAMVAVSRSEDPRDGFITYWWDETHRNGSCMVAAPCGDADYGISGEGGDYPTLAIAPKLFTVTAAVNRYDPSADVSTLAKAGKWIGCESGFTHHGTASKWCGPFYSHLMLVDANKLAAGCDSVQQGRASVAQCPAGRSFGVFVDSDNWVTDWADDNRDDFAHGMARGVRPVTMHTTHVRLSDTPPFAEAFFVSSYIDRSVNPHKYYLTLFTYMNDELTVRRYPLGLKRYRDWQWPMSAVYRDGRIWVAHHDCWPDEPGCVSSIRLSRINLTSQQIDIDRRFGLRSVLDDSPSARFEYQFPALAITTPGDLVVSYVRHPVADTTWQEVRYSVWYAGESDLRSSRLLKSGSGKWPRNRLGTDVGGMSLDPSGTSVWVAQTFTNSQRSHRLAFGQFVPRSGGAVPRSAMRVAGERMVDLLPPSARAKP